MATSYWGFFTAAIFVCGESDVPALDKLEGEEETLCWATDCTVRFSLVNKASNDANAFSSGLTAVLLSA